MKQPLVIFLLLSTGALIKSQRIIGGTEAADGEFPFSAAIRTATLTGLYFCGGALVAPEWVLTSAYCIQNGVEFNVSLGSNSLTLEDASRLTLTSNLSFLHPDYTNESLRNDVGLIRLPAPVQATEIQPIGLPIKALDQRQMGRIIGWGQTDEMVSGPVDKLNQALVVTLSGDECRHIYGGVIFDSLVCVQGNLNEGICIGDIGSPFVIYDEQNNPIHGGVSTFFSWNGCENFDPTVITSTFAYMDWINYVISQ